MDAVTLLDARPVASAVDGAADVTAARCARSHRRSAPRSCRRAGLERAALFRTGSNRVRVALPRHRDRQRRGFARRSPRSVRAVVGARRARVSGVVPSVRRGSSTPCGGCGAGSGASICASRRATCSGWPTCPRSVESWLRSPRSAWRPRSASRRRPAPFAVIGMGKLGGAELNYASDVDVLFVHDGDSADAERVARSLLDAMRTPTADGIVFRTDADLRPEGRAAR